MLPLLLLSKLTPIVNPKWQGLCHQSAHLRATADFIPRFEALGTPKTARVMYQIRPLVGPPLILSPALKR